MLNGGNAVPLENVPYAPIIEVANTYKNALPLAAIFEFCVGRGRLFVCTLDLKENDAGARWLKNHILEYVRSDAFRPKHRITEEQLRALCGDAMDAGENENEAANKNDITMN